MILVLQKLVVAVGVPYLEPFEQGKADSSICYVLSLLELQNVPNNSGGYVRFVVLDLSL